MHNGGSRCDKRNGKVLFLSASCNKELSHFNLVKICVEMHNFYVVMGKCFEILSSIWAIIGEIIAAGVQFFSKHLVSRDRLYYFVTNANPSTQ